MENLILRNSSPSQFYEDQRQLEYFHFTSTFLHEDFRELTTNNITENLNLLKETLLSTLPLKHEELEQEVTHLGQLCLSKAQAPLSKFKEVSDKIFSIPLDILLPDSVKLEVVSEGDLAILKNEVDELKTKYLEEVEFQGRLKQELKNFEELEASYDEMEKIIEFRKIKKGGKSMDELISAYNNFYAWYVAKLVPKKKKGEDLVDVFNLFKKKEEGDENTDC